MNKNGSNGRPTIGDTSKTDDKRQPDRKRDDSKQVVLTALEILRRSENDPDCRDIEWLIQLCEWALEEWDYLAKHTPEELDRIVTLARMLAHDRSD